MPPHMVEEEPNTGGGFPGIVVRRWVRVGALVPGALRGGQPQPHTSLEHPKNTLQRLWRVRGVGFFQGSRLLLTVSLALLHVGLVVNGLGSEALDGFDQLLAFPCCLRSMSWRLGSQIVFSNPPA